MEEKRSKYQMPTKHNAKRRGFSHDYSNKGLYMITMVVKNRRKVLSSLVGTPSPHVELSPLGEAIINEELPKITRFYPAVKVWKTCVMPDHLHFILHVSEDLPAHKHLGKIIAGFKSGCTKAFRRLYGENAGSLFEKGYNDKYLKDRETLLAWSNYMIDNPRRFFLKKQLPQFFTIYRNQNICGDNCQMIGNTNLLNLPQKCAVIYHRRYTESEFQRLREEWLACGAMGGVIVTAAVHPKEKEVYHEAMRRGYNVILLTENGFPPIYKPYGQAFYACANGRLLQISPWEFHQERKTITRSQCLFLNAIAEKIATHRGF